MQLVKINSEWLKKIEVQRESEMAGGFQRKLSADRARAITKYMGNGHQLPPIFVGKIGGRYICIDGQHRLEARKLKEFPLFAVIQETDSKTAADEFESMNTMGARVPLLHRIKISSLPIAKYIRSCADNYGIDIRQVYAVVKGVSGRWQPLATLRDGIPSELKNKVESILDVWTKDKRWKSRSSVYSRPGILSVVGGICRNRKNIKNVLGQIQELSFSKPSALYEHYGAGGTSQKYMKEYIIRKLFNGMDE